MEETLDDMMQRGRSIRDQMDVLNEQLSELAKQKDILDEQMLSRMGEQGVTRTGNDFANISVSETENANVADWDAFYGFIKANDAFHLLQRRITSKAAVEYKDSGEEIPGVTYFTKTALNFRRKN